MGLTGVSLLELDEEDEAEPEPELDPELEPDPEPEDEEDWLDQEDPELGGTVVGGPWLDEDKLEEPELVGGTVVGGP